MDVNAHCAMIFYHLPVFKFLARAILTLPAKFLFGSEMVGISVIRVYVLLSERHQ